MRRLLMLIAVLGAAAPLVLLAVQDDEGSPAASAAAHEHHAAQVGLPPQRAVVLARESRELAVALAIEPGMPLRLTATIINGQGAGVDDLDVELIAGTAASGASNRGQTCGRGCYTTSLPVRAPTRFAVNIAGAGPVRSVAFPQPGRWAPTSGTAFLARATRAFRSLRTVLYTERLSSGPGHTIFTTWKLEAPNSVEYAILGGADGIVIGRTRWDRLRAGAPWEESTSTLLPQPIPSWSVRIANAYVLHRTPSRVTISWLDRDRRAWFTGTFDRATARPIQVRMTGPAHFMRQRYRAFNHGVRIVPPT